MNATQIRKVLPDAAWRRLELGLDMPALLVTPARALDDIAPSRLPANILDAMTVLLGAEGVRTSLAARAAHTTSLAGQLRLRQGDLGAVPDAVLSPRSEADVLALLRLCADAQVAVGTPPADAVHVALDLAALNQLEPGDALAGQVHAGGGLTLAALDSRLAERGLMAADADPDLTVSEFARTTPSLTGIRLATPQGLAVVEDDGALAAAMAPSGVVTAATLAVRRRPVGTERIAWRFADFAAGLAALREAELAGIVLVHPRLSDAEETGLFDSLAPERGPLAALLARLKRQQDGGALLQAGMTRADQARLVPIAKKLGARAVPPQDRMATAALRAALLERGAAMDGLSCRASWARLPGLYANARAALDQTMRQETPRAGAHGLVMASLRDADALGARLTLRWLFARRLGDEATQATAIRARAQEVVAAQRDGLTASVRAAIGDTLDPSAILKNG